jgi:hypothetical protein
LEGAPEPAAVGPMKVVRKSSCFSDSLPCLVARGAEAMSLRYQLRDFFMRYLFPLAILGATPAPYPSPTPTLPISYDDFCYNNHAGAFQGLVTGPTLGVVVLCRDADFIFYKSAIPKRVNHWPGARGTMPPGRTS